MPEPWGSQYDLRALLNSAIVMRDFEKLDVPHYLKVFLEKIGLDVEKTDIGDLLRDYGFIGELGDNERTVAVHKTVPRVTRTVL